MKNLLEKNIKMISDDINIIKRKLTNKIEKIGVFGSMLEKPFNKANDVDVVIYCKENYELVKHELLNLELSIPISPHKMNGMYGFKENETTSKHYHIILLNSASPNKEFERINQGKIAFI